MAEKDAELLEQALADFDKAEEADRDNRVMALEDIRFVHEEDSQWTDEAKRNREGRPTMTFDRTSGAVDQLIGDQLQNRPGIKFRAAEGGDTEVADIYTGMTRAIENASNAKRAVKNAFKFAVSGGVGVWQIRHDWVDENSFFQDILWEPINNPFSVVFDPFAELPTKEDGRFVFKFMDMDKETFEATYPDAESRPSDFQVQGMEDWFTEDTVRIADYYRKVPVKKTIYLLSTGEVLDKEDFDPIREEAELQGITVERERESEGQKIEYYKITGVEILEKVDYVGKYFPIVPVWGKRINIAGEVKYRGIVRKAKDPQRLLNYELNAHIETVSQQPKAPYLATSKMIKGHEKQWENINVSNDPVMLYEADPQVQGGGPRREPPPQASNGQLVMIQQAGDLIKSATNIFDASLGDRSNETSGIAIQARDRQGDTANYEFTDELAESLHYTGRILVDLIPKIYDTQRQVRILGEDETEDVVEVNKPILDFQTGEPVIINDLRRGKYDVHVTTGPAYSTKRVETSQQLGQIMAQNPQMAPLIGDIWVKSLDIIEGEEITERLRRIGIQQGFIKPNEEEQQEMSQQQQAQQEAQQRQQQLEDAAKQAEIAKDQAEAQKTQMESAKTQAETQTEQTEAILNMAKARAEQAELASQQGDQQALFNSLRMLQQILSSPRQGR